MSSNRLLFIPAPDCFDESSQILRSLLLDSYHPSPDSDSSPSTSYLWDLQTKYYSAQIEVLLWKSLSNLLKEESLLNSSSGLVLVFKTSNRESFTHLESFMKEIEELPLEVKLCVGVSKHNESMKDDELQELDEKCMEHGQEFVHVVEKGEGEECTEESVTTPLHCGGTSGVKRVLEALQCCMWPDMNMKRDNKTTEGTSSEESNQGIPDYNETQLGPEVSFMLEKLVNNFAQMAPSSKEADEKKRQEMQQREGRAHGDGESFKGVSTEELLDIGWEDDEDSLAADSFASSLDGLQALRTSISQLPDDQRRAAASKVTLALWSMLGEDE